MDYGHWIRLFQIQYLRAKGLFGYVTSWTIATEHSQVITGTIFSDMDAYYLLEMKLYTHQVHVISTGRYYDDVNITNGTLILDLLYTRHANDKFFIRCRHLQYMYIFWDTLCTNQRT